MLRLWAIVAGSIGAFALVASAHAADPARTWRPAPPPEPEYEKPEPKFRELLSGWYLRGDLGYRWNAVGSASTATSSATYGNAGSFGAGFGYKYQWFRADVTIDRALGSKIGGATSAAVTQPQYSARITVDTFLANAYIDLGSWAGFTPYVGAGVGISRLRSDNYVDTADSPPFAYTQAGKSKTFSWAWMAGVAYQVQPNWMIDVGFRHLQLGDVPGAEGAGETNNAASFKNLSANEVRLGVRFLFD